MRRVKEEISRIKALRPLSRTNKNHELCLSLASEPIHQLVDPLSFKLGKWTETPFPGVTCFGVSLSQNEVVVVCQVERPIRMKPHEHGPWREELVLMEGVLYEHTTCETFMPGVGVYKQSAGCVHEPEFRTPARAVITWTRKNKGF